MARSGFLTSIHRLAKQVARENERQRKASQRAYAKALREAEAAQKRGQQAYARAQKASAADQKRLEKEARESHEAAMAAEVECRNLNLAEMEEELEGILVATLGVDDFVDLNTLRVGAMHPPFHRQDLMTPTRPPLPITDSPMPVHAELPAPRGLLSFLSKSGHEKAKEKALAKHHEETIRWQTEVARNEGLRAAEAAAYEERERARQGALKEEQDRYAADCARREGETNVRNREVDELIANLAYGTPEAVEEYIGIVLSNAVYPDHFPISHDYSFDPSSAELRLAVAVISPEQFPAVKAFKYVKASDEITEVPFSSKACKDRYAGAVHQVALRVPHEIFEADRRGLIGTISLKVGTHGIDPATGSSSFVPLVALGVAREDFMKIELANVQPAATLAHLGASVSKNPYGLIAANVSGVRKS
jgi:restriction system protein